jgi:rare lipoprotein A
MGRCDARRRTAALTLAVLIATAAGCALFRRGAPPSAPPPAPGQVGMASWYGPGFDGRATASGERFDQDDLTAAHRRLPLGTHVRVTNLANGRSVVVRINDRGPYARGRLIDVSRAAARRIGMTEHGVTRVHVERVDGSRSVEAGDGTAREDREP